jgi:AmmeMemoRadiSam system protein B
MCNPIIHLLGEIMLQKVRAPVVAGQFYDENKDRLKETIKECFLGERGPGKLPEIKQSDKQLLGIVVPHAGFIYSGAIAAHSYHFLASTGFADTFIILGPNHTGMGSGVSIITEGKWLTPLGSSKINETLAKQLVKDIIDKDENAHKYEHSIEVQIPFIQFIAGCRNFDFVPICMAMQDIETATEVGNIIADAIQDFDKKTVIIASSDLSHAGFNYSSMPPESLRVDEYAKKQDMLAIDKILNLDPIGLIETVHQNNITMCGYGPVAAMLTAAKILGAKKAELLKYATSYEVHPGTSCVGYGAIAVY